MASPGEYTAHTFERTALTVVDPLGLGKDEADACVCVSMPGGWIHPCGHLFRDGEHLTLGKWYNNPRAGFARSTELHSKHVLSLVQIWNGSFQHIAFDTIPKIPMIKAVIERVSTETCVDVCLLVVSRLQQQMLDAHLRLGESRYIIARPGMAYLTQRAYYINFVNSDGKPVSMGSSGGGTIRSLLPGRDPDEELDTVCYISRRGAGKREVHPADEASILRALLSLCRERGLNLKVVVNPKTPEEIRDILRRSAALVSVHGGALGNQLWCRPQTAVVEIIPRASLKERPCFYYLANALGLRYAQVEPNRFDFDHGSVRVDARRVEEACRAMLD